MLTANLAAFLIGSEVKKVEQEEHQTDKLLREVLSRLEKLEGLVREQHGDKDRPPAASKEPQPEGTWI